MNTEILLNIELHTQQLQEAIDSQVKYETTHQDAGDGYSHMPREGGWMYNNTDDKLKVFIEDNEIDVKDLDLDEVAEIVLDNFEMVSGHTFSTEGKGELHIDSYPLQEIEISFDLPLLANIFGVTEEEAAEIWKELMRQNDFCLRDRYYAYETTDCIWIASITADYLQECINDTTA
jgi:hypothetical protein